MDPQRLPALNNIPFEIFHLILHFTCNKRYSHFRKNNRPFTIQLHNLEVGINCLDKLLGIRNRRLQTLCRNRYIAESVFGKELWKRRNERTLKCAKYGAINVLEYCLDAEIALKKKSPISVDTTKAMRIYKQESLIKAAIGQQKKDFVRYLMMKYGVQIPSKYYYDCLINKGHFWNNGEAAILCYNYGMRITMADDFIAELPKFKLYIDTWCPAVDDQVDLSFLIAAFCGHEKFIDHFIANGTFQLHKLCLELCVIGGYNWLWRSWIDKGMITMEADTLMRIFAVHDKPSAFSITSDTYEELLRLCLLYGTLTPEHIYILFEHHCKHGERALGSTMIRVTSNEPNLHPHLTLARQASMAIALDNDAHWAVRILYTYYKLQVPEGYTLKGTYLQAWQDNTLGKNMLYMLLAVGALDNVRSPLLLERMYEWLMINEAGALITCIERDKTRYMLLDLIKTLPNSDQILVYVINLILQYQKSYTR